MHQRISAEALELAIFFGLAKVRRFFAFPANYWALRQCVCVKTELLISTRERRLVKRFGLPTRESRARFRCVELSSGNNVHLQIKFAT